MKRISAILLLLPIMAFAQTSERFIAKGLLSGKGTLAAGIPTAYDATNMYVSGNIEYYTEDNISFRGGLYVFLGASRPKSLIVLSQNSTCFFGYNYHLTTHNHLDPYIGFEPGVSWTQLKAPENQALQTYPYNISDYKATISPVASATLGINYYAARFTHLFMEVSYINGMHLSDIPAVSLSEFHIAFGFGFNILF